MKIIKITKTIKFVILLVQSWEVDEKGILRIAGGWKRHFKDCLEQSIIEFKIDIFEKSSVIPDTGLSVSKFTIKPALVGT